MGLFSKKMELERDLFVTCLNMDKTETANFRERNGFKVKITRDADSIIVDAKKGGIFRCVSICNVFHDDGRKECTFFFTGLVAGEMIRFMNLCYPLIPNTLSNRILPTGEILVHNCLVAYDQESYSVYK